MASVWFLLAIFSMSCASAYSDQTPSVPQQWIDSRYISKLKAVTDILWKTFASELQQKQNVVFFTVSFLTDVAFIYDVSDEITKQEVRRLIDIFDVNEWNLATAADEGFSRSLSNETKFKTIFHGNAETIYERKLDVIITDKLSLPNNRFNLITRHFDDKSQQGLIDLLKMIETDTIGTTCGVRYCPVQEILSINPPFAILTFATLQVKSVAGFEWSAPTKFTLSDSSVVEVRAAQAHANYDYAEFKYPTGCIGRVLRLPYRLNYSLIFVVPWGKEMCKSPEVLWENVQGVNFNGLQYKNKTMFVSIPLFKVSANIDLRMKLKGTAFAEAFVQPSSTLQNAVAFQAAEIIFNPEVAKDLPKAVYIADAMTFEAKSPFFFALTHETSPTPIVAGLISNPRCTSECDAE